MRVYSETLGWGDVIDRAEEYHEDTQETCVWVLVKFDGDPWCAPVWMPIIKEDADKMEVM